MSALVDLPTANRCWAPSVWVEERACFLDQAKQGPPESRTQAGPAAPAGRTPAIDHCDLQGPQPVRGSQLERLQTGGVSPRHRRCLAVCHLYAPWMTAGWRGMMFIASQGNFLPLTFTFTSRKEKNSLIQSPVRKLYWESRNQSNTKQLNSNLAGHRSTVSRFCWVLSEFRRVLLLTQEDLLG